MFYSGSRPRAQAVAQIIRENEFTSVDQLRFVDIESWLQGERLTDSEVAFMQDLWNKQVFRSHMFISRILSVMFHTGAEPRVQ